MPTSPRTLTGTSLLALLAAMTLSQAAGATDIYRTLV